LHFFLIEKEHVFEVSGIVLYIPNMHPYFMLGDFPERSVELRRVALAAVAAGVRQREQAAARAVIFIVINVPDIEIIVLAPDAQRVDKAINLLGQFSPRTVDVE